MVTNVKEGNRIKCQQYWPDSGKKEFGPFQVIITDQQVFADYVIRTLSLSVSDCHCLTLISDVIRNCFGQYTSFSLVQDVLTR